MPRLRDLLYTATGEPGDDLRRRAATRGVVALAGVSFCLSAALAFTMPILFGVDERVHLAYVEVLLRGELPEVDQDVPLDGRFVALREFYPDGAEAAGPRGDVWVANHPPLGYVLAALPAWVLAEVGYDQGPPMVLRLASGLGMALGVVAVAAVADALLPGRRAEAMAAAGLAALAPAVVSIGSYGYNDGAAFAVGTALVATTLRVARSGATRPRLVALALLGAAAVLTRSALLPLVPLAALVWLVRSWRAGVGRAVIGAALVGLVPIVAGGWFYLRNIDLYGSVTGAGHLQRKFGRVDAGSTFELLRAPSFLLGAWQDLWGSFRSNLGLGSGHVVVGSADAAVGTRIVTGGLVVGAGVVGFVVSLLRRRPALPHGVLTCAVAVAWVAACVVGLASFTSGGGSPHPRYLFPALSVLTTAAAGGMGHLPGAHRLLLPGALLGLLGVDLVLLSRLPVLLASEGTPSRFAQPGWSTVVVVLALSAAAAAGAIAAGAWREVCRPTGSEVDGGALGADERTAV